MNAQQQAFPAFRYTIAIDGTEYTLELRWNTRFAFWVVDLYDAGGLPVYLGRKLLLGDALYADIVQAGIPPNPLGAVDTTGSVARIARGDLGNAVGLFYAAI